MPYTKTKDNRLVNEVTLGDGYPLSNDLQPLKIGGEASILGISSPLPDGSDSGLFRVDGDLDITGTLKTKLSHDLIYDFDDEVNTLAQVKIDALIDSAPAALDTLNELAAALGDDASFATTVTNSIATKVSLTGNETIAGQKTFSQDGDPSVIIQDPNGSNLLRLLRTDTSKRFDISLEGNDLRFTPNTTDGSMNVLIGVNAGSSTIDSRLGVGDATPSEMLSVTGNIAVSGTVDGVDIATRDAVLTSTTTTANAALPLAGGTLTGAIDVTSSSQIGVEVESSYSGPSGVRVKRTSGDSVSLLANYSGFGGGLSSTDALRFTVNDADANSISSPAMYIETDGKIGIGTESPTTKFHIKETMTNNADNSLMTIQGDVSDLGTEKVLIDFTMTDTNANNYPQVKIGAAVGQNSDANSLSKEGSGAFVVYTSAGTSDVDGEDNTAERMRVDYQGNVGIGTTSPSSPLHIVNGSGNTLTSALRLNKLVDDDGSDGGTAIGILMGAVSAGSSKTGIFSENAGAGNGRQNLIFAMDTTADNSDATLADERMRITHEGKVGIGTTSPTEPLEVYSANSEAYHYPIVARNPYNSETNLDFGVGIKLQLDDGSENKWASIAYEADSAYGNSGDLKFYVDGHTNSTPRMTLLHEGKLGIGTTSPARRLDVTDSAIVSSQFASTSANGHLIDLVHNHATDGYNGFRFYEQTNFRLAMSHIQTGTRGYLQVGTNYESGSEIFVVDGDNQRVGIGTASPTTKFQIYHTAADGDDGMMIVRDDTSTADGDLLGGIGFDSTDGNVPSSVLESSAFIAAYAAEDQGTGDKGADLVFGASKIDDNDDVVSHEYMRITDTGVVSIGTPATGSPNMALEVVAGANDGILINRNSTSTGSPVEIGFRHTTSAGDAALGMRSYRTNEDNSYDHELRFFTTGGGGVNQNEWLTIKHNGKVGIGTTSPTTTLDVDGTVSYKHTAFTTAGPTDNVDVSDTTVLEVDTSGGSVTIGGFTGGVQGQILYVIKTTSDVYTLKLENSEGGGSQDIFSSDNSDISLVRIRGGVTLYCNGTSWFVLNK